MYRDQKNITQTHKRAHFASFSTLGSMRTASLLRDHLTLETTLADGPLTRYVKLRMGCAWARNARNVFPDTLKETASYRPLHPSRYVRDARAVMHVGIVDLRGKRSRYSWCRRNPQFYVSGKRSMVLWRGFTRMSPGIQRWRYNSEFLFIKKTSSYRYRDFHYNLRRSSDRLRFNMGIHIYNDVFLVNRGLGTLSCSDSFEDWTPVDFQKMS